MKRLSMLLVFALVLFASTAVYADGITLPGGRSCPNGQTTCLVGSTEPESPAKPAFRTVFGEIWRFFGWAL